MIVLQHSSVGKSLLWQISYYYFVQCQSRDLPLNYAVTPSFISCLTTFYCIDPYFIFKLTIFKIQVCLFFCCGAVSYNITCINPLVFSTSVGVGKAETITYKHFAHLLNEKLSSPYSVVIGRLRCSLRFSLLHSSAMSIRDRILDASVPVCLQPSILLLLMVTCRHPLEQYYTNFILC